MSPQNFRETAMNEPYQANTARSGRARACSVWLLATAIFLLNASRTPAQSESEHTPRQLTPPMDVTVPIDPTAFKAGGKWHLVYELHVANLGRWDCQVKSIEVLTSEAPSKSLASYADAVLDAMIFHPVLEGAG
jgi:hypothetical protein